MADRQGDANEVVEQFQAMQREADALWGKINEFDLERQEHDLVLKTLRPLDPQRRCFRLVGGVLVERSVEEVAPALERHKQALEQVRVLWGPGPLVGVQAQSCRCSHAHRASRRVAPAIACSCEPGGLRMGLTLPSLGPPPSPSSWWATWALSWTPRTRR